LNITPGSVSVLGLMNDSQKQVKLLIDKDLLTQEYIGCHPCINTSTLKIKLSDIQEKLLPHLGYEATIVDLPVVEE
ncbi:MAG: prolyl-tRNA synthetase associated domain-containing protein, partial [Clostridia bacterium]|nr:prolyl-tRNA synthetase associated domain-containing protein [Clostridia bacterium]